MDMVKFWFWIGLSAFMMLCFVVCAAASLWFAWHHEFARATWFLLVSFVTRDTPNELLDKAKQVTAEMRRKYGLEEPTP